MHRFVVESTIVTKICEKPVKINFYYDKTLCFEYLMMPWETGLSKTIAFELQRLQQECDNALFSVQSEEGKVLCEKVKIAAPEAVVATKSYTISHILDIAPQDYSVVKITKLSPDIAVTYAHICNQNIYIAGSDTEKASLEIPQAGSFEFQIELFQTNVMIPEKTLICTTQKGEFILSEKSQNITQGQGDARHLRNSIQALYPIASEKTAEPETGDNTAKDNLVSLESHKNISEQIFCCLKQETEQKSFAVIKITGLSEQNFKGGGFYRDGAYFIAGQYFEALNFDFSNPFDDNKPIQIDFYGIDTFAAEKTVQLHLKQKIKSSKKPSFVKQSPLKLKKAGRH